MNDVLLDDNGDLMIGDDGDISFTNSEKQAVRIRLLWFINEWRFAPQYGVPYFEEVLVKNPDLERLRRIVRDEAVTVDEVVDVKNITISVDTINRTAAIRLDIVLSEDTCREEVIVRV